MKGQYNIPNTQRRIVRVWAVIFILMVVAAFSPAFLGIGGMDGGFGITVMASFVAFTALLVVGIYHQRARQFDAILSGADRLASWPCSAAMWQHFVAADFNEERVTKRSLFFLVSAIAAVVGLLMFLLTGESLFLLIVAGLIAVLAIPATLVPVLRARRLQSSGPVVIIGRKGLIVGKMFHYWGHLGARLEDIDLERIDDLLIMRFHYSYPTRNGRQTETARVPVPDGMAAQLKNVVETLKTG